MGRIASDDGVKLKPRRTCCAEQPTDSHILTGEGCWSADLVLETLENVIQTFAHERYRRTLCGVHDVHEATELVWGVRQGNVTKVCLRVLPAQAGPFEVIEDP